MQIPRVTICTYFPLHCRSCLYCSRSVGFGSMMVEQGSKCGSLATVAWAAPCDKHLFALEI